MIENSETIDKINKYIAKINEINTVNGINNTYLTKLNYYVKILENENIMLKNKYVKTGGGYFSGSHNNSVLEKFDKYDYGRSQLDLVQKDILNQYSKIDKILKYAEEYFKVGNQLIGIFIPEDYTEIKNKINSKINDLKKKVSNGGKEIDKLLNLLLTFIKARPAIIPYEMKTPKLFGGNGELTIENKVAEILRINSNFKPNKPDSMINTETDRIKSYIVNFNDDAEKIEMDYNTNIIQYASKINAVIEKCKTFQKNFSDPDDEQYQNNEADYDPQDPQYPPQGEQQE